MKILTSADIATCMQVHPITARRLISEMPGSFKIGRERRITEDNFHAWLEAKAEEAATKQSAPGHLSLVVGD